MVSLDVVTVDNLTPQYHARMCSRCCVRGKSVRWADVSGGHIFLLTIVLQVTSSTGTHHLDVLPDSGADISAAGQKVLEILGQHVDNILPSDINPRTVNGLSITPLGRLPVTITLGTKTYQDDLHIYPGVSGALISWKAAKGLGILPPRYPYPHSPQGHSLAKHIYRTRTQVLLNELAVTLYQQT